MRSEAKGKKGSLILSHFNCPHGRAPPTEQSPAQPCAGRAGQSPPRSRLPGDTKGRVRPTDRQSSVVGSPPVATAAFCPEPCAPPIGQRPRSNNTRSLTHALNRGWLD